MPTVTKPARLITVALMTTLATASVHADMTGVQEVPLERYTSYPNITPVADSGQETAPKAVYQNGMVLPMVYSPKTTVTYSPHYTINGNGSSIIVPSFPLTGPVHTGAGALQRPAGEQIPAEALRTAEPVKEDPKKLEPAAVEQGPAAEQTAAEPTQDQTVDGPVEKQARKREPDDCGDKSDFVKQAKMTIKADTIAHVNSIRASTIMKEFGDSLMQTRIKWVCKDGKRTNEFRSLITFFEGKRTASGVRACRTITNGRLVPNADKKQMEVQLDPTATPKYCLNFKDGKRTRISALDGSVIAGEAREDVVKAEAEPKEEPKETPKDEPKEAPKAQAQVEAPRQDGPTGAK